MPLHLRAGALDWADHSDSCVLNPVILHAWGQGVQIKGKRVATILYWALRLFLSLEDLPSSSGKLVIAKDNIPASMSNPYLATYVTWEREGWFSPQGPRTCWEQAGCFIPGAPSAARSRRLMGSEFTWQNQVGREGEWERMIARVWGGCYLPIQLIRKLFVFCLPKKPLCIVETCLSWTPNNKHTATSSPGDKSSCNEQGVTDKAP